MPTRPGTDHRSGFRRDLWLKGEWHSLESVFWHMQGLGLVGLFAKLPRDGHYLESAAAAQAFGQKLRVPVPTNANIS